MRLNFFGDFLKLNESEEELCAQKAHGEPLTNVKSQSTTMKCSNSFMAEACRLSQRVVPNNLDLPPRFCFSVYNGELDLNV